jgi:flagellar motility protein MotE (MotC chaperone)
MKYYYYIIFVVFVILLAILFVAHNRTPSIHRLHNEKIKLIEKLAAVELKIKEADADRIEKHIEEQAEYKKSLDEIEDKLALLSKETQGIFKQNTQTPPKPLMRRIFG